MLIKVNRKSVCMGDDIYDHLTTFNIDENTRFSDVFNHLIETHFFPSITGNDVVWTLICGDEDLISWKTKNNKFYSRFVDEEPTILSRTGLENLDDIYFEYYSPPLKRAKYIFKKFNGEKFHIWHSGFMTEYETYKVSEKTESEWLKEIDNDGSGT